MLETIYSTELQRIFKTGHLPPIFKQLKAYFKLNIDKGFVNFLVGFNRTIVLKTINL